MIEIYGKFECPWCDRAVQLCEQYFLEYKYKALDDFIDGDVYKAEFKQRAPLAKTVPQIFWHGKLIGGFEALVTEIENTRNFGDGVF